MADTATTVPTASTGSCTLKWVFIILTVLVLLAFITATLLTRCFGCKYTDVCTDYQSDGSPGS